jgi:hypothetical protein
MTVAKNISQTIYVTILTRNLLLPIRVFGGNVARNGMALVILQACILCHVNDLCALPHDVDATLKIGHALCRMKQALCESDVCLGRDIVKCGHAFGTCWSMGFGSCHVNETAPHC